MFRKLDKFLFYTCNIFQQAFIPNTFYSRKRKSILENMKKHDEDAIWKRVNYYNKLDQTIPVPKEAKKLSAITYTKKSFYYYDYRKILRYFDKNKRLAFRFGDVKDVTGYPRVVKTRPINQEHKNSILLKLNALRHYQRITDNRSYRDKKDLLVWRGKVKRDHRQIVFQNFFNHPLCNIGKTNRYEGDPNEQWNMPRLSIEEQLDYKFILSIEGNDIATNLKWIAQSNSLCFMTRPKYESWFMEGSLEASKHYVELRDDYSDLPEKIEYYIDHPEEAETIIAHFQSYFQSFLNQEIEQIVSFLVVEKYLNHTSQ